MTPEKLRKKIISEVSLVLASSYFKTWLTEEKISKAAIILINNSFLERGTRTRKSSKYLGVPIDSSGKIDTNKTVVVEGDKMNNLFKAIYPTAKNSIVPLIDAIKTELSEMGETIFALVGEIHDVNEVSELIDTANIKKLTLSPALTKDLDVIGDEIKIKSYVDRDAIWVSISGHFTKSGWTIPDNFGERIDAALDKLTKSAFSNWVIPKKIHSGKKYFLDLISDVVNAHIEEYSKVLPHIADPKAYNEVLRISYNFVSDINKLIALIIRICDLKPLILWLALSEHFKFDIALKELPVGFTKKKPSLEDYETMVKNARNKTFHQFFPVSKMLLLKVPTGGEIELKLFPLFGQKMEDRILYKDQKLHEQLLEFTRATEERVNDKFWAKNVDVMKAINSLIMETSSCLKHIRETK